jgi:hypothetical protein
MARRLRRDCSARGGKYQDPSQQNTFTGRLTPAMLIEVLQRARERAVAVSTQRSSEIGRRAE